MDLHNWIMDIHNSIMDLHNSIMDLHNYGLFMEIHNWYLWRSIIRIMDIIRIMEIHNQLWRSIINYGDL